MSIMEEIDSIKKMLSVLNKRHVEKIEGHIAMKKTRGHVRFYLCSRDGKDKYLNKAMLDIVPKYYQGKYDDASRKFLNHRLKLLENLAANYETGLIDDIYESFNETSKEMITPVRLTDSMFAEKWLSENYNDQSFSQGELETKSGILVRSKSEKIIADALTDNGLLFVYEKRLELASGYPVHPDFCILDTKNRRTVIWEHFGLMNKPEYVLDTYKKLASYYESGFIRGETIIYSCEGNGEDISKQIKTNINWLLKGGTWSHFPIV